MMKAIDLRKGKVVALNGELYTVHDSRHVAKGNKGSYMQTKLRGVKSGNMIDIRFNVNDRVEAPYVDTKPYEYLYRDGDSFVVMDTETFDQIHVPSDVMSGGEKYLTGNEEVVCSIPKSARARLWPSEYARAAHGFCSAWKSQILNFGPRSLGSANIPRLPLVAQGPSYIPASKA